MKKKIIIALILCIGLILLRFNFENNRNDKILEELNGNIYYLMKDNNISKLYKADANLNHRELIYSHEGKGLISEGRLNDNILDFRYYPENKIIEFEAMHNGEWSIFQLSLGETEPKYIRKSEDVKTADDYRVLSVDADYINLINKKFFIHEIDGSVFMNINGNEECILKYNGVFKSDISGVSGYTPQGLSPDGKFLVYGTTGSKTGIGYFLGLKKYKRYIMNLETKEYAEYVNSQSIQWIIE